ncbi:hypothetical protein [Streptomyces dubilierae]|uniref:Uncharacterized protein n=1 Tax=Streptomyces dubilierae TaxID=3075533 RepID=A0ABU2PGB0_9ACTN|nr:hypothetical protein [Streptomyces sp. DSM 41921]MDT0390901.1 hypothetical protein [Streptomyces sp. DSM 41921]
MVAGRTAGIRPRIDEVLVRRLVDTQFPQWAELVLEPVEPTCSDHVIYRLGEQPAARLPCHAGAIGQARKEYEWLPRLFTLMSPTSRAAFRDALGVDDASWLRGRGWALATGLNAYTTYAAVDPRVAAQTSRRITQALIG